MTLFFFHIPKTGGTSFKRVIETWAALARDADLGTAHMAEIARQRPAELCVTGHFDARLRATANGLLSRFPWIEGNADAFVFTLLRDPIEQAVSAYYHERAAGRTQAPLSDFIAKRHDYAYRAVLETDRVEDIAGLLSSFAYVGLTEQLQLAADQLADRLGKPRAQVPRQNVGKRDEQAIAISGAARHQLEALYSFECELYARARESVLGGGGSAWTPATQFVARVDALRSRAEIAVAPRFAEASARLVDFFAHDQSGAASARFDCREPVALTLTFEVLEADALVEPSVLVRRDGQAVFSVAYVPEDGEPERFAAGQHTVHVKIPGNLLNVGRFEIMASLATPAPVRRHDQTAAPLVIEIVQPEDEFGTARGSWRTAFPGGVRPLLKWRAASR